MQQQDLVDFAFLSANEESHHQTASASQSHLPPLSTNTVAMKEHAGAGAGAGAADDASAAAQCPVDHKSREAWMERARAARGGDLPPPPHPHIQPSQPSVSKAASTSSSSSSSSWGWRIPFWSSSSPSTTTTTTTTTTPPHLSSTTAASSPSRNLGTQREVSSIPRSSAPGDSACPVNHEAETGADAASGNWVYPSEKMFFDAMRRKGHGAAAADMRTVVPIHNAVNERAWAEIREWERPYEKDGSCPGGPRLHSFAGLSGNMSPRARLNTLLGYTAPFDRHDWVVDRCGTKVDYIIDFYAGSSKAGGGPAQGKVSFYLDVRPKLNSWEGVKMRAARALGLN